MTDTVETTEHSAGPTMESKGADLVKRFGTSWGRWKEESRVRGGGQDVNLDHLRSKLASLFVTATHGQEIQYVEATVRKADNVYEFLVLTDAVLAYCSCQPGPSNLIGQPELKLIPRSALRSLQIQSGFPLGDPLGYASEESVVLGLDYGPDVHITLPLDPEARRDNGRDRPLPVDHALLALIPGLLRDANTPKA